MSDLVFILCWVGFVIFIFIITSLIKQPKNTDSDQKMKNEKIDNEFVCDYCECVIQKIPDSSGRLVKCELIKKSLVTEAGQIVSGFDLHICKNRKSKGVHTQWP